MVHSVKYLEIQRVGSSERHEGLRAIDPQGTVPWSLITGIHNEFNRYTDLYTMADSDNNLIL